MRERLGARSSPQLGAVRGDDRVDALLAELADLGVGQRAVGGPELQREREAHPARRRARRIGRCRTARTDSSSSPPASRSVRTMPSGRHRVGDDEREVDRGRRVARHRPRRARHSLGTRAACRRRARTRRPGRSARARRAPRRRSRRSRRSFSPSTTTLAARTGWKPGGDAADEPPVGEPELLGECFDDRGQVVDRDVTVGLVRQPARSGRRAPCRGATARPAACRPPRAARTRARARTARRRDCRARRCAQPRAATPARSAGRSTDSSARNGFSTSINFSGSMPARARSAGATSGSV